MRLRTNIKVRQNFAGATNATVQDLATGLFMLAEEIMTDSKTNYVPVDTGNLRNSGTVALPVIAGNRVTVTLGYGGPAAAYALKVHEAPASYGHGKNKYLSKPINAAAPKLPAKLTLYIRNRMSRRAVI